ncbi:MAG: hypothetical protein LH609_06255 [Rudanella sp.]|nr:hypothetical protein [Rudanella sp.]
MPVEDILCLLQMLGFEQAALRLNFLRSLGQLGFQIEGVLLLNMVLFYFDQAVSVG